MNRLWQPERPLVYGYLCVEDADEARLAVWSREIASFCTTGGYRLGSIFIDRDVSTGSFARGGFVELLAALRVPTAFGVVVPTLAHLSTETFVQQALAQMVRLTDSQLLVSTPVDGGTASAAPLTPGAES